MIKFIVWVGGIADYEGNNIKEANSIFDLWIRLGYDDVILERV